MAIREGDYVVLPRGTMWRIDARRTARWLLLEATNDGYGLPEQGIVGHHAIFDPAVLDTPGSTPHFAPSRPRTTWRIVIKRRGAVLSVDVPLNPLDAVGWHGTLMPVKPQLARHPAGHEPSARTSPVGTHHLRGDALRRVHVLSASARIGSRRIEGARSSTTTTITTK